MTEKTTQQTINEIMLANQVMKVSCMNVVTKLVMITVLGGGKSEADLIKLMMEMTEGLMTVTKAGGIQEILLETLNADAEEARARAGEIIESELEKMLDFMENDEHSKNEFEDYLSSVLKKPLDSQKH